MWWCCGKIEKKAPGCKTKKHVGSNENDLNLIQVAGFNNPYRKCTCCKEMGHKAEDC